MSKAWDQVTWQEIEIGGVLTEPGSARNYNTGDWRSSRPVWDKTRCIKCGMCQMYCPEGCVKMNEKSYFEADLYHCKGCGICARECPVWVITMKEET